ncbi:MAG: glycosyltransferase [Patescibacteria group bacterium]|jgi:glycosyltransferase involved in cell wall biosynthesis/protein-L-isoaspartate O-methyltransferase
MRPSRPYHAVTAYHREPGGLRRLDFFVDKIMRHAGDRHPAEYKILDIGCGSGNIAVPLAVMGFDVTGIDLSDAAVKATRLAADEVNVKLNLLIGGVESIAGEGQYDAIICSEVLEHQSDPEGLLKNLKEKLASNGILLLSVPNGQSLEERSRRVLNHSRLGLALKNSLKKLLGSGTVQSPAQDPHVQFYSYRALTSLLRQSNFWIMESDNAAVWFKEFFYLIGRAWMKRGSRFFHVFDAWDNGLAGYWPRFASDGWLLELQKVREGKLVVQLIPTLGMGGAERIVYCLARQLPKLNLAVVTLAHVSGGAMEKKFNEAGLPHVVFNRVGFLKRWKNFWTLRRALIDLQPAWVHTHLFGSDFWGRLAAKSAGVPKIATTEHNLNSDFSFWRVLSLKITKNLADEYVAISKQVKGYLVKSLGLSDKKIRLIYNGIDLKRIRRRSGTQFHDIPKLIFVGRLEPQKDPELILKALAPLKQPWELSVVGSGSLGPRLKHLADELRITPRIRFMGVRQDVPELLTEHDLFLFPSLWEGFGLVVLEAAAAGVPVITSDLPVVRELLSEDQVVFVPAGNVEAWTRAIESALADPAPLLAKAQHAADADWSRFSEEHMAAQYAEIYGY